LYPAKSPDIQPFSSHRCSLARFVKPTLTP
jgi:hypothetical protein